MMSSQHAPYILGYTRTTMVGTMSCDPAKASQSQKPYLSSDCTLQLECMKAYQNCGYFDTQNKINQ